MTLLIAFIANAIYEQATGKVFIENVLIFILWVFHVLYHAESSKEK